MTIKLPFYRVSVLFALYLLRDHELFCCFLSLSKIVDLLTTVSTGIVIEWTWCWFVYYYIHKGRNLLSVVVYLVCPEIGKVGSIMMWGVDHWSLVNPNVM